MSTTSYQGIVALSTILPVLDIGVVGLRFYARIRSKARLQFDDWAQIPAVLLFIAMSITCLIGVANKAIGYPDPPGPPTMPAASTILCEKLVFALQILQIIDLAIIKCAALAFYRRVFCAIKPSLLNAIIWVLITITTAWAIAFIGFYAGSCGSHPTAAWKGDFPFLLYCIDLTPKFEKAFAASDFILDTLILVVPLPSIWNLRMTTGRKIGITGIFLLAFIGYGACTARLARIVILAKDTFGESAPDIQLADTQAIWFSMLETGFTLIAVNLPSIWSIISKISPESIIRSVRSMISLRSIQSKQSNSSKSRVYQQTTSKDNIELVAPEDTADFSITVEGKRSKSTSVGDRNENESGIYVQKSLQVDSREHL